MLSFFGSTVMTILEGDHIVNYKQHTLCILNGEKMQFRNPYSMLDIKNVREKLVLY